MTKIILINGPARSGKDTLGEFIASGRFCPDQSPFYLPHYVSTFKFAGVMQTLWRGVFETITETESQYRAYVDGDKKNEKHPFLDASFREAMIDFSENYIKPTYGKDFFGRLTAAEISRWPNEVAVITDSGFESEAVSVIEKFGAENVLLIKLSREGYTFTGDSRNYIDLEPFGVKTVELENKDLEQFRRDGVALVREFLAE